MLVRLLSQRPSPHVWVVVASGGGARVFRAEKQVDERPTSWLRRHPLVTEDLRLRLKPVSDTMIEADTVDDYNDPSLGHTITPHPDLHTKIKKDLAHDIAETLDGAAVKGFFDHLVLIAPKRLLARIMRRLGPLARGKLLVEVPKNLMPRGHMDKQTVLASIDEAMAETPVLSVM